MCVNLVLTWITINTCSRHHLRIEPFVCMLSQENNVTSLQNCIVLLIVYGWYHFIAPVGDYVMFQCCKESPAKDPQIGESFLLLFPYILAVHYLLRERMMFDRYLHLSLQDGHDLPPPITFEEDVTSSVANLPSRQGSVSLNPQVQNFLKQ